MPFAKPPRRQVPMLLMWATLLFAYLLNFFHSLTTAILQPELMRDFHLDTMGVTAIGSMYFYSYLMMQVPTGVLIDRFGVRITAFSGTLLANIGTLCFAMANNQLLLYIGRSCIGAGMAVIFICIIQFQKAWCRQGTMTTMTGIACFVGTMGGIVAQSPLAFAVTVLGWRSCLLLVAVCGLLNALSIIWLVRDSPQGAARLNQAHPDVWRGLRIVLTNPQIWPPFVLYAMCYGSYVLLVGYSGTEWLTAEYRLDSIEASSYMIAGVLGSAFGSIAVGAWADRPGSGRLPMLVTAGVYTLIWVALALIPSSFPHVTLTPLLFATGFFSCAFVMCWSYAQRTAPGEYGGIAVSVVNMGGFVGPIILPYIFTLARDAGAGYGSAFGCIAIGVGAGFCCGFLVKTGHETCLQRK